MNLNEYQSTYIDKPGIYEVSIVAAENNYTKNGKECVAVKFQTDDNQITTCSYVEAVYFKLFRLAQSAGLAEAQRANFEPSMLVNKSVKINVVKDAEGRLNVAESFAIESASNAPLNPIKKDDVPF